MEPRTVFFHTPSTWDLGHKDTFLTLSTQVRLAEQKPNLQLGWVGDFFRVEGRLGAADVFRITFVDPSVRIPSPDNYLSRS